MRMLDGNSSELYHGKDDERDDDYNNDKEQYASDYWSYINNGEAYDE